MLRKLLVILVLSIILFHPQLIQAYDHDDIEIFDPQQEKVVKEIPMDKEISRMVLGWIGEIDEIYASINPITDDGYAIRFPFNPAIEVKNRWLDTSVKEVYLIVPEKKPAFFIVFQGEDNPLFFLFHGEIDDVSDALDFKLK